MGKPIFLTLNNITNSKTPAPWTECIHPRYELLVNAGSHFQTPASKSPKTVSPVCKAELSLLFLLIILLRTVLTKLNWRKNPSWRKNPGEIVPPKKGTKTEDPRSLYYKYCTVFTYLELYWTPPRITCCHKQNIKTAPLVLSPKQHMLP
jgi:hypothetical protein